MVRLVLFDIDGTLIRTGGAGVEAFGRTAELFYGVAGASERMRFHGRTDTAIVREFFQANGMEPDDFARQRFLDAYVFLLEHRMSMSPGDICSGVREFLEELSRRPRPPMLGLLTGNIRLGAELKLRPHGLWGPWETGAFGDDHEERDELARIAKRRASDLIGRGISGDEVLVIGDTTLDVQCARAIGARCLAVCTGGGGRAELAASGATWVADSLECVTVREVCA